MMKMLAFGITPFGGFSLTAAATLKPSLFAQSEHIED